MTDTDTYTIDAAGKKLGRVATEAASVLMGKNTTAFVRHATPNTKVEVVNASKLDISTKKKEQKIYKRFSGFPGGLKEIPMEKVIEKKGYDEVVRKAVHGMLPGNRLRDPMLKRLIVSE